MNQQKKAHAPKPESVANTDESVKTVDNGGNEEVAEIPTKDKQPVDSRNNGGEPQKSNASQGQQ